MANNSDMSIEFDKKDILILDFMIDEVLNDNYVNVDYLIAQNIIAPYKGELFDRDFNYDPNHEFLKYFHIIKSYNVCECIDTMDGEFIKSNTSTMYFKSQGGFKKVYDNLLKNSQKEEIDFEKSKVDLDLAKKMLKEFPKTKWFARIGFAIAILLALKELYILLCK